jgi:hypothetical protein
MNNEIALYRSLMIIRNSDEFKAYREWLEDQREKSRDRLETTTEEIVLRQEQGASRVYKTLIGKIEDAPKTLEKLVDRK